MQNILENEPIKTVIAALFEPGTSEAKNDHALTELSRLVETAGGDVVGIITQYREKHDVRTWLGEGKIEELSNFVAVNDIALVVFNNELSPSQIRNIEDGINCRVFDRSMLILEIFSLHAHTHEGRLQVEMAQLKYTLPRLTGKGIELSRLGGGGGMGARRGKGETLLELSRRKARSRILFLQRELTDLQRRRNEQRSLRERSLIRKVAVIGYTNAGKSTLIKAMTGADTRSADQLFTTLEPLTRRLVLKNGGELLLTDTVGFISDLPHRLIEAFSSTLEEVSYADLLLHVVDASDPDCENQRKVCEELVAELGAAQIPTVIALNKWDLCISNERPLISDALVISAKTGAGVDALVDHIAEVLASSDRITDLLLPYDQGGLVQSLYQFGQVLTSEYRDDGIYLRVRCSERVLGKAAAYRLTGRIATQNSI